MFEKYIVVFVTASSEEEAQKIANSLVEKKIAACVNIVGGVNSIFSWQGKIDRASESLLIVKTKECRFDDLKKEVKLIHSYDTPEIIAMPIVLGDQKYLEWIDESVR